MEIYGKTPLKTAFFRKISKKTANAVQFGIKYGIIKGRKRAPAETERAGMTDRNRRFLYEREFSDRS